MTAPNDLGERCIRHHLIEDANDMNGARSSTPHIVMLSSAPACFYFAPLAGNPTAADKIAYIFDSARTRTLDWSQALARSN